MFSDKEVSADALAVMIRVMALLNDTAMDMQKRMSIEDFSEYKRLLGGVMGNISLDILPLIYSANPELEPKNPDEWVKAGRLKDTSWLKY